MILYKLACDAGHGFESWFRDSAAYEAQEAQGLISCPTCRSTEVARTIMAPAIVGGRATSADAHTPPPVAILDEISLEARALLRRVRDKVVAEGHDVGAQFAAEARRMNDGETPVRQIYGQATREDARALLEDGIMILPMPTVPEELN